ncbi:MAG TPA: response regulator [Patescibacteria group bacterium]|nr:response regulator [Patescibacteria group bacterium]
MEILLVDDDRECLKELVHIIEPAGHRCRAFQSTAAAVAEPLAAFDVVITEWKKPQLDGLAVLDAVRERQWSAKVIILTGYGDVEGALAASQYGAYAFLCKPVRREALLETLAEISQDVKRRNWEKKEWEKKVKEYRRLKKAYDDIMTLLDSSEPLAEKPPVQG